MRNIFKYPPLEWRKRHEYTIPQGPNYSWASRTTLNIAGSRLVVKAPSHSPRHSMMKQTRSYPGSDAILDAPAGLHTDFSMPGKRWGIACLWSRRWAFYGPWMTGCKAELSTAIAVVGWSDSYRNTKFSFLNPKAFETVLTHYLNDRYGHENWEGDMAHIPRYHGPVDWRSHDHLPVPSASFKVFNRAEDVHDLVMPDELFVFPVSDEHFVVVTTNQDYFSRNESGSVAFDKGPLQELQDNIFNSITLELGPETQARVDQIKAEVGNMQMCKEFAPLKWPTNIYPPEPSEAPEMQKSLKAGC